jgi:hypothetical protein
MNTTDQFLANLVSYLSGNQDTTVVRQDSDESKDLPLIICGYRGVEQSRPGLVGHYTVDGFVTVQSVGYDGVSNDTTLATIERLLYTGEAGINAGGGVHVHALYVRGFEFDPEGIGNSATVNFEAFIMG